jgi:phage baseplate assembly protein V
MQPGVMIGLVKSVEDPAGQGRVQLTFPTMGGVTSAWAPVASELAGNDRGAWFMPELNDEVLVAFDHGEFDHPYVIGFLWNGNDKPPDTEVKNRIIKTPGGHQLRFEDKDGARKVILKTDGGLAITMDDAQQSIEIRGGGRTLLMKAGQLRIS